MAKRAAVRSLAQGVSLSVEAEYRTSDNRAFPSLTAANRWQTYINRREAIKNVLRDSGLLAYKNNDNILSVGPLADHLFNPAFIERLQNAANGRNPRTKVKVETATITALRRKKS